MKISNHMNIFTVRKKILLASKLIGVMLIVSYMFSAKMPIDTDISFAVWMVFVVVLICTVDLLMARFISKPVSELNEAAHRMAELDFSNPCTVTGLDEFGELSRSLNRMGENLQQAFAALEAANVKLEQDVEQKKRLLAERKELVDNLSHEMKTPLGVIRAYTEGLQDETDEEKRTKYSEVIIAETERMNCLITTLLDLSTLSKVFAMDAKSWIVLQAAPPISAMGVTEILLFTMGIPNSPAISSPVFTRSLAASKIF